MTKFEFPEGSVEIDADGDIWIRQDADRVVVCRAALREFFTAIDAARDEALPPEPIEIPDPTRYDAVRARVAQAESEPVDPDKVRAALGKLNLAVGNCIAPGAEIRRVG